VSLTRHHSYLERAALREAQKVFRDRTRAEVKIEEFLVLRVQTVEWWKRLLAILLGLAALGFAGWSLVTGFNVWITLIFGIVGLGVFLGGLIGVLNASAEALFNRLLDALF
jgi:heme A synthase